MTKPPLDSMLDLVLGKSRNMLVPWYLITSYLYYQRDVSLLTDARYDALCNQLHSEWDDVQHMNKDLIDRDSLKSGTGYDIRQYPTRVMLAACHLAQIPPPILAPVDPPARPRSKIRFTIKKKGLAA